MHGSFGPVLIPLGQLVQALPHRCDVRVARARLAAAKEPHRWAPAPDPAQAAVCRGATATFGRQQSA
eukprot:CAMPEP_0168421420 /NCGR_PEP_ID=MMETSP0228-20121227/33272_1 /TAXON_ID=133427 /ORGANISM="Protoceratium reticulatum, Strain CCCM 535 (=CCMP 1889)" /LENGTH=66 /DNA_ID=CAMNT_0008435327 /DNA_START=36 /DNA_END=233 /DNA_ORIENTATION=-